MPVRVARQVEPGKLVVFKAEPVEPGQSRGQAEAGQAIRFKLELGQVRQSVWQEAIGQGVGVEVEGPQVCERPRKREGGEVVDLEVKPDQVDRRFQAFDTLHVPPAGVQDGEAKHIRHRQRSDGFPQGLADRGVQTGIGNGYFLGRARDGEGGQNQQGEELPQGEGLYDFHR